MNCILICHFLEGQMIFCAECKISLNETPSLPEEDRVPCFRCGSKARFFDESLVDGIIVLSNLRTKARHEGEKKPFYEGFSGEDLHRDSGKWMEKKRTIDRDSNRYSETIKNPETGKIVHDCLEPLDQHKGHGSAKWKNKKSEGES